MLLVLCLENRSEALRDLSAVVFSGLGLGMAGKSLSGLSLLKEFFQPSQTLLHLTLSGFEGLGAEAE